MRIVKMMINGVWRGDVPDSPERARQRAAGREAFRARVSADGAGGFPAEGGGRYHLYVSHACPSAHRAILYRALKGLEEAVGMYVLHPRMGTPDGWTFTGSEGSTVNLARARTRRRSGGGSHIRRIPSVQFSSIGGMARLGSKRR